MLHHTFEIGTRLRVHGLPVSKRINGTVGKLVQCRATDEGSTLYTIQTWWGDVYHCKGYNLQRAPPSREWQAVAAFAFLTLLYWLR
jgi:hypothetical protein